MAVKLHHLNPVSVRPIRRRWIAEGHLKCQGPAIRSAQGEADLLVHPSGLEDLRGLTQGPGLDLRLNALRLEEKGRVVSGDPEKNAIYVAGGCGEHTELSIR